MLQPRSVSEKWVRCSITRRLGSFEGIGKNMFHLRPISCWSYMACIKTPSSNPSKQGQRLYIICGYWDIDARELDNQTPRAKSGKKAHILSRWFALDSSSSRPVRCLFPRTMTIPTTCKWPTSLQTDLAKGKEVVQTRETLRNKMKRADHKRFLAWTQVYEKTRDEYGDMAFTGTKDIRALETYIKTYVRRQRGSGRVAKLIALIMAHVEKG